MQTRLHCPERQREGLRDLAVGQSRPGVKQEDVALALAEVRKRIGKLPFPRIGCSTIERIVEILDGRVDPGARLRQQLPPLLPPVVTEQVRGDAVEPGADRARVVEALPVGISRGERLRGEVVGERPADPPPQVAVQRRILVAESLRETASHTTSFPLVAQRFPKDAVNLRSKSRKCLPEVRIRLRSFFEICVRPRRPGPHFELQANWDDQATCA